MIPENPITIENKRAGTKDWILTNPATQQEIEGYASTTSVNKAVQQPDVGDVGAPDLVGADDLDTPEQIRVNLVLRMRLAGVGPGRHACQAQFLHQAPYPLAVHGIPTAT